MIKNGKIELGKTPSAVTGKPSKILQDGEPIRKGEKLVDPGLTKLAAALEETPK
jgi:hypothetical protein